MFKEPINSHERNIFLFSILLCQIEPSCVMCGTDVEDGGHLFFKCKKVKALWTMMLIEEQTRSLAQIGSAKEAVQYIMNQKTKEKVKIAILLWSWWSERNNVREGNNPREAREIRSVEIYTAEIDHILKKKP
jgi:hypothetical protein